MRLRSALLLVGFAAACHRTPAPPPEAGPPPRPKLLVYIAVDQLPTRLLANALPMAHAGLARLSGSDAFVATARHHHASTVTCPGHATLSTGASPSVHGIVGNAWYVNDAKVYCADPAFLRADTLADRVRAASGRVVSVGIKDRSPIMLGGHDPTSVVWFDRKAGGATGVATGWLTPPAWKVDGERVWTAALPADYAAHFPDDQPFEADVGSGAVFPHRAPGDDPQAFLYSPDAGTWLTDVAIAAIDSFGLGEAATPDLLAIAYSQTDLIGHAYTADSWEALDGMVRLDADLGRLFDHLDARLGAGGYAVMLTSDHGSTPGTAARIDVTALLASVRAAATPLGAPAEPFTLEDPTIWLPAATPPAARQAAATAGAAALAGNPGLVFAIPWRDPAAQWPSDARLLEAAQLSLDEERSGDIAVMPAENAQWSSGETKGTGHGSPWDYDQLVPFLAWGAAVRPGHPAAEVDTRAIAGTGAALLGLEPPRDAQVPPDAEAILR